MTGLIARHGGVEATVDLQRDADLQGAALRLLLRAVEASLRAHSAGPGPAARIGAAAFIQRFGSTLKSHLHFLPGLRPGTR